jgi:phosphate transport system protein
MAERSRHIITSFDAALYGLKNDVLMMSSLTDRIFQTAFEALLKRDSELCDHVVAEDEEIDILEKQVDQDGVNLLIRFHPVASDMREVVSAMKVSANLERIADQSVSIARRAKHLNDRPAVRELALLEPPYRLAVTIFRNSVAVRQGKAQIPTDRQEDHLGSNWRHLNKLETEDARSIGEAYQLKPPHLPRFRRMFYKWRRRHDLVSAGKTPSTTLVLSHPLTDSVCCGCGRFL